MNSLLPRIAIASLAASLFLGGCGGGSGNEPQDTPDPVGTTATVALLFTDLPSDEFKEIKLNVLQAILIGGDGVDGQQTLFDNEEPIDLLNLTNFSEPIVFGEVEAGIYTKLRLIIDDLELVPFDDSPSQFPALPANGKIDLLDPNGIEILPGRTMIIQIDLDANKALHLVGAGKSGRYQFRPVVKADFMDGDLGQLPDKLARLEGTVNAIPAAPAGSFELCDIETPDSCVDVATGVDTSIFDDAGAPGDFSALMTGDTVVVIGNYTVEGGIVLNAVVLEIGGNAEQMKGNVVSDPADDKFLLQKLDDTSIVVELQIGTKYYDADGALGPDAVVLGADIEVEGVQPPKADPADPDLIRAALVFIEAEEDEQLSGTIVAPVEATNPPDEVTLGSFNLTPGDGGGDVCVRVLFDADILLVDIAASTVTMAAFADIVAGQVVDLFGTTAGDSCFEANEVIVDVNASP